MLSFKLAINVVGDVFKCFKMHSTSKGLVFSVQASCILK